MGIFKKLFNKQNEKALEEVENSLYQIGFFLHSQTDLVKKDK